MIYVDTRVTIICLMFSKITVITRITLKKRPPFLGKWPPKWHDVFGNTFSRIYAPQNIYIEPTLEVLRLLCSEIDVLLWKWPPFVKWVSQCRIEWCDTCGNNFSEIYAPCNLYIESTLNALRLSVSAIDVIFGNGRHFVK